MAAAAGGAGRGVVANVGGDIHPLLSPSVGFIYPKTRAPAFVAGEEGPQLFKVIDSEECRKYFQPKILIDKQIAVAPAGVYTWILKDIEGYGRHLFAIRTVIRQEVGTLHANLDQFTQKGTVIIAGELKITVDETGKTQFLFNKLSGTYTKGLKDQDARMEELMKYVNDNGITPAIYIEDTPIINAEPNDMFILPTKNAEKYKEFCSMRPFLAPTEDLTITKKRRLKGGAHRKSRKSRKHHRRRKSHRTLKRGQ